MGIAQPPGHLSVASKKFWAYVVNEAAFEFESHHFAQLGICCAAMDRAAKARQQIQRDGQMVASRYGQVVHPLLAVERESQRTALRALAALKLDAPVAEARPHHPGPRGAAQ
jgi:phage terminase small subunit